VTMKIIKTCVTVSRKVKYAQKLIAGGPLTRLMLSSNFAKAVITEGCREVFDETCSWINFMKSPTSKTGYVSELRLMSLVRRVRELVCILHQCVSAIRAVVVPVFV
jgi:hypothetical protein